MVKTKQKNSKFLPLSCLENKSFYWSFISLVKIVFKSTWKTKQVIKKKKNWEKKMTNTGNCNSHFPYRFLLGVPFMLKWRGFATTLQFKQLPPSSLAWHAILLPSHCPACSFLFSHSLVSYLSWIFFSFAPFIWDKLFGMEVCWTVGNLTASGQIQS